MLWKEIKEFVNKLTEEQLNQPAHIRPYNPDGDADVELQPVILLGSLKEDDWDDIKFFSSEDGKVVDDAIVIFTDCHHFSHDKDGNPYVSIIDLTGDEELWGIGEKL